LYACTAILAELLTPLCVDFTFEVECAAFIGEVARSDEECEGDPAEEGVDGKEGTVVEEDTSPPNKGGDEPDGGGDSGDDEFWAVADADNVCMRPDVEPGEEAEDERDDGVGG